MLSAIAARKAAQAAQLAAKSQASKTNNKPDNEAFDNDEESEKIASILQRPESKRKPSIDGNDLRNKKGRKKQRTAHPQARYFATEAPDHIIIDDEEEGQDVSSSMSNDDDETFPRHIHKSEHAKRAWSPSHPPLDSSDDDGDEFVEGTSGYDLEVPPSLPPLDNGYPSPQNLSFTPVLDQNVFHISGNESGPLEGRSGTIIALSMGETLALQGVYSLSVLRGVVSIMGSDIHASSSSHHIFAPKCSPIPIIKAVQYSTISRIVPEYISKRISTECAIILLEEVISGVEGLGRVCKVFEGVFGEDTRRADALRISTAHMIPLLGRIFLPYTLSSSWERALLAFDVPLSDPPIVLVKGAKRTGKSTLARTLLNRLLGRYRRVAFLECDIGQTEFTPPGLVSLTVLDKQVFGPAFTHPTLPLASHFIGSISPRHSPSHYITAIQALVQTYKLEIQYSCSEYDAEEGDERVDDSVPLIVNTMGWMKGLGADLSLQVEEAIGPSHTFSVQSSAGEPGDQVQNFEVEAIPANAQTARYSAVDWRTISLISYFHSVPSFAQLTVLLRGSQNGNHRESDSRAPPCTWDTRLPLVAQRPYMVQPRKSLDNVVLVGAGIEDVVPSEIGRVLNGAIVALVSCQSGSMDITEGERLPYSQASLPPDPSVSNCVGLALIRAISPSLMSDSPDPNADEEDALQLLTPVPPSLLASVPLRCLVKGEIEIPVWAMLDHRDESRRLGDNIPYLQWSRGDALGAERRRVRRNLMRKAQM